MCVCRTFGTAKSTELARSTVDREFQCQFRFFGFMLYVVACVPEWLSDRTHPVESRSSSGCVRFGCEQLHCVSTLRLALRQHTPAVICGLRTKQLR